MAPDRPRRHHTTSVFIDAPFYVTYSTHSTHWPVVDPNASLKRELENAKAQHDLRMKKTKRAVLGPKQARWK
jgi:hypothetical protein